MKILITGSAGFIGKNLSLALQRKKDISILEYDLSSNLETLHNNLSQVDIIYHLAGVNRPKDITEYETGNFGLTQDICTHLKSIKHYPKIIFASSIQAQLDNPYGISKKKAEEELKDYSKTTGSFVVIYRLKNVFGKWCRPNYNSAVATFCHNIAHGLPISVSDPKHIVELMYIDDVIQGFISQLETPDNTSCLFEEIKPSYSITLEELVAKIQSFHAIRNQLIMPDMKDDFTRKLYATYISYLAEDEFDYSLTEKKDERGSLAELLKSPHFGQIFVSRTRPGITRGNHYHDTKIEKFLVLEGEAIIRFRQVFEKKIIEYRISGTEFRIVDIPPGYTHSIENVGNSDMVVLFWASEIFNPDFPDTYWLEV